MDNIDMDKFNWDLFNWKFYSEINKDLNIDNKEDAILHFKNYGYLDKRLYSFEHEDLYKKYDWDQYLKVNIDVNNIYKDKIEAINHYINYGKKEKRKIFLIDSENNKSENIDIKLKNFNLNIYRLFNIDLKDANIKSEEELKNHFKNYGKYENRIYSKQHYFLWKNNDWNKYLNNHNLLGLFNELNAFYHYMKEGINESKEIYPLNISNDFYLDFYIKFNNFDEIYDLTSAIKQYESLEYDTLYSFQHYLIKNLFDWEDLYLNKKIFFKDKYNLVFNSLNDFIVYYIYNYKIIDESFNININNFNFIFSSEFMNKMFTNNHILKNLINYNIRSFDKKNINKLLDLEILLERNLIDIDLIYKPIFFDFNDYINIDNDYNFRFVISSYNNENNIYNNLMSIIYQNNKNWKIIYTNDASTDKTSFLFKKISLEYNLKDKIKYIENVKNKKQSYCKYNSYKYCDNDEIVIILDGDDWLSRNDVLSLLTTSYNNSKCLALYTGYKIYYNNTIIRNVVRSYFPEEIQKNGKYRTYESWKFTHIKTAYSHLFKSIPSYYLKYNNNWLDRCTDLAEYYCVAELAKGKIIHLPEICCIYNKSNSILFDNSFYNDEKTTLRKNIEFYIKNLNPLFIYLPKIYIINLQKEKILKQNMIKRFDLLNIKNYEFFNATYALEDKYCLDKFKEYQELYNKNLIPKMHVGVEKKHINSIGAIGILVSTLKLFEHINKNTDLDHVLILEDDVYINKNFYRYYLLNEKDFYNKDFVYLGYNSISKNIEKLKNSNFKNEFFLLPSTLGFGAIYGAFSYICSRKFRQELINNGLDFFIKNNLNLDLSFNYFRCSNIWSTFLDKRITFRKTFEFYCLSEHLFVPDVLKPGINGERNLNYYKERNINLDKYYK